MFNHAKIMNFLFPIDVLMRKSHHRAARALSRAAAQHRVPQPLVGVKLLLMDYFTTLMVAVVPSL